MDNTLLLKIFFKDDVRRITVDASELSMSSLNELLSSRYAIDASTLLLKYLDEDQDLVTIADDMDLKEAFSVAAGTGKLHIKATETAAPHTKSSTMEESLQSLAAALGVEVTPDKLAAHLSHAAPFVRGLFENGGGMPACAMFKMARGGCGPRMGGRGMCRPSTSPDGQPLHWGVTCDISNQHPIVGTRYHKVGEDFDLCEAEFNKLPQEAKAAFEAIPTPKAKHWGVTCDVTGQHPIVGTRYKKTGQDFDLCEAEYLKLSSEEKKAFEAIEKPQGGGCRPRCGPRSCQPASEPVAEGSLLPAAPLSRGARGPGVAQLQSLLIQLGVMHPGAVRFCMGMYGPRTTQAIAAIQSELQAEPTGQYDELVRAHLLSKLGVATSEEAAVPQQEEVEPVAPEAFQLPEVPRLEVPQQAAEDVAQEAEMVARAAEREERANLLVAMGFSETEVEGALSATQGSLERAADWLFVARKEAEEAEAEALAAAKAAFPVEWAAVLSDVIDMGFNEEAAKEAIKAADGNLKAAVKTLVSEERTTPRE